MKNANLHYVKVLVYSLSYIKMKRNVNVNDFSIFSREVKTFTIFMTTFSIKKKILNIILLTDVVKFITPFYSFTYTCFCTMYVCSISMRNNNGK